MTYLMSIDENARRTALAIKHIFNVDVVIIDEELNRIADTFGYSDKQIVIRSSSIVGMIVKTGKALAIDDKDRFETCKACIDRGQCAMHSLIGVPVWLKGKTIGAIGLIIPEAAMRHLFDNLEYTLDFLNEMATNLSLKVQASLDLAKLNQEKLKREMLIHLLDDAAAILDEQGLITFSNHRFNSLFFSGRQTVNIPVETVFQDNGLLAKYQEKCDVSAFPAVFRAEGKAIGGQCCLHWAHFNGQCAGAILLIRLNDQGEQGLPSGKTADEMVSDELQKYLRLGMNKTDIASILGISRATLYRILKKKGHIQDDQQQTH